MRVEDVQVAGRRLAVVEGRGGHHRIVSAANRFFAALGDYLRDERPVTALGYEAHRAGAHRRAGQQAGPLRQLGAG